MKLIAAMLAALVAAPGAQAQETTKTIEARDFTTVSVEGVYELGVTIGEGWSVVLSGEPEDLARAVASVENGALVLKTLPRPRGEKRERREQNAVSAAIVMPMLEGLSIGGVVDGRISGVDSATFSLSIAGVGDIDIEGRCGVLDARVSGVGDLDAEKLLCKSVKLSLSGVGDAQVHASESVEASVSGVGDATVYGSPKTVKTDKTFFSSVTIK